MERSTSRRSFIIRTLALGVAGGLIGERRSGAAEPRLDMQDPAARALGYVEDAGQVDARKYPKFVKGSNCENCLLLEGTAGNRFRPCSAFGGKLVSVSGWCASWTPEM